MKISLVCALILLSACANTLYRGSFRPARPKAELTTTTPFDLVDNRIFITVFINHQGPFKFMFDTGGANVMTPELAKKLDLQRIQDKDTSGAGEKSVKTQRTKVDQIQIGQIVFLGQNFQVIDLSDIKHAMKIPEFDGIFGYEVLEEYILSVSFQDQTLTLDKEFKEGMRTDYSVLQFQLVNNKPVISGEIQNQLVKILIDTGDRSALTIFKGLREKKEMASLFKNAREHITGYGVGGPIPALLGHVPILELHPQIELKNVIARSPTTAKGFNAITDFDASVGNEVLKQFELIFDYRNKYLYMKKNENFGQQTKFTPVPNP